MSSTCPCIYPVQASMRHSQRENSFWHYLLLTCFLVRLQCIAIRLTHWRENWIWIDMCSYSSCSVGPLSHAYRQCCVEYSLARNSAWWLVSSGSVHRAWTVVSIFYAGCIEPITLAHEHRSRFYCDFIDRPLRQDQCRSERLWIIVKHYLRLWRCVNRFVSKSSLSARPLALTLSCTIRWKHTCVLCHWPGGEQSPNGITFKIGGNTAHYVYADRQCFCPSKF